MSSAITPDKPIDLLDADDDIICIEEVRKDIILKAFFKMQSDSIQKVVFSGLHRVKDAPFKDLYA
jgi:hypothetical protein